MSQKRPSHASRAGPSDGRCLLQTAALVTGQKSRAELNPWALGCLSPSQSLCGEKACRVMAIWYLQRLMPVKSPAFCSSQKTTEDFRQTFLSDKEEKIFWKERETSTKPLEVNRSSPIDEGAHIQNFILCFSSYCLCLWDEEGRESCKHTRINHVLLLFATTVTELGGLKFNQDEQQDFSQDKMSLLGVSVYFKQQLQISLSANI